jgi:hypothetical protein
LAPDAIEGGRVEPSWFETVLHSWPIYGVGALAFGVIYAAAVAGRLLRRRLEGPDDPSDESEGQEAYIVTSVAGLLALLLGFTFTMAVDRFDARRVLVLHDANAIGTTYLRTQLIPEPHRTKISVTIRRYVDNRVALGRAAPGARQTTLLARNDALIADLWTATVAAWGELKPYDFSSTYLETMNNVIDLDAARKAARLARVPSAIFAVLFVYMAVAAGVFGYVIRGPRSSHIGVFLLALFTLSLMLIVDIDRPVGGRIVETQRPMEELGRFLAAHPPGSFGDPPASAGR